MRGDFSCAHRDLPLTLALSQGRGKVSSAKKSGKLILPPFAPSHNPSRSQAILRPGPVIRGRGEDGARPVGWS